MPHYILDFYCPAARLAIEVDGAHHDPDADAVRELDLALRGIFVVRVENRRVREEIDAVVEKIRQVIAWRVAELERLRAGGLVVPSTF